MCIISPLLLLAPEVAQHASARNCNSTEWQFLSLPSTLTYSVSHSAKHTHTYITYVNVSHHFKRTHRTIFLLSRFPTPPSFIHLFSLLRTPSINTPLSFASFSSPSLPPRERTHPLFPVFSADVYPGLSTIRPIKAPSNWTVYVIHIKTESSFCFCFLMSLQDETSYYVLASGYGGSR